MAKIFVIEDDRTIAELLQAVLQHDGDEVCLSLQGKLDESEVWLTKAAAANPDDPDVWMSSCRMAEARGMLPQAWEKLAKGLYKAGNHQEIAA